MGELAKTRDWYEKVIALPNASEADKVSAQEGLAELCYCSGEYKQAVEFFHEVLIHYQRMILTISASCSG